MPDIEKTCRHIRTKRYKRAAHGIVGHTFEEGFFHLHPQTQKAIVHHIAERLKHTHKKLRIGQYRIRMTKEQRRTLSWQTYYEIIDELSRDDEANL